jgi:hypothetical protein
MLKTELEHVEGLLDSLNEQLVYLDRDIAYKALMGDSTYVYKEDRHKLFVKIELAMKRRDELIEKGNL